ncbi:MAG: group 1 glycosyl transferase [Parcubacteria group bacterium LiPW_39]|nr:MAG: group 1 glycosyl transferase [Parcubacteria group bacterium LiPW_39]
MLEAFCEIWPEAPIFTLIYDEARTGRAFAGRKIKTSFLQKVPLIKSHHRPFLMLMPLAVEQFNLSKYDLVISDSASFAKGVITRPKTLHLCYCHTPTRYVWDDSHRYVEEFNYPKLIKRFIPPFLNYLRLWDEAASSRPDKYIANSHFVAQRIKKYYQQSAQIIYPPVKTQQFYLSQKPGEYFLIVSRFLPYKKIDLAVAAFNELGWPLKIIGDGPERRKLKKMASANIEFVGLVPEYRLVDYYTNCRALIFPQEEDFGISAVEAMSAGRPVVAYRGGGALEIIREGENGLFFEEQTTESLVNALKRFRPEQFDSRRIQFYARQFDKEIFKNKIKEFIQRSFVEHQQKLKIKN